MTYRPPLSVVLVPPLGFARFSAWQGAALLPNIPQHAALSLLWAALSAIRFDNGVKMLKEADRSNSTIVTMRQTHLLLAFAHKLAGAGDAPLNVAVGSVYALRSKD